MHYIAQVCKAFEDDSTALIHDFLLPSRAAEISVACTRLDRLEGIGRSRRLPSSCVAGGPWFEAGPCHKQRFLELEQYVGVGTEGGGGGAGRRGEKDKSYDQETSSAAALIASVSLSLPLTLRFPSLPLPLSYPPPSSTLPLPLSLLDHLPDPTYSSPVPFRDPTRPCFRCETSSSCPRRSRGTCRQFPA
jgi:hypothetical protein